MIKRNVSSHVVAICWDSRRFHFLVAATSQKSVTIRESVSLFWKEGFSAAELAECVKMTLKKLSIRKPNLLIGVARSQADVFSFDVPPASDAELPGLVMNGVARQQGEIKEDDLVDYAVRTSADLPTKTIEAAVLRPEVRRDIEQLSETLEDKPKSIVLRPFSVASLFRRLVNSQKDCLIVNRLDEAADLLVFNNGTIAFQRSVRLESEPELTERAPLLSEEILRTLASAPQDLERSAPIQRIFLFGVPEKDDEFVAALEQDLALAVTLVNPFEGVDRGDVKTEDACPYAALVGMVRDFQGQEAEIDFANPKKPPKSPNRIRQAIFYSVAAAATIAILAWSSTEEIRELKKSNDQSQTEVDAMLAEYRMLRKRTLVVDDVAKWRRDEINWLDELRDVSRRFPKSSDAVVDRINLGGNRISMSVRGRDPSIVKLMGVSLRDHPYRKVDCGRISQPNEEAAFPCQFEATLTLMPRRPKADYLKPLADNNSAEGPVTEVARDVR